MPRKTVAEGNAVGPKAAKKRKVEVAVSPRKPVTRASRLVTPMGKTTNKSGRAATKPKSPVTLKGRAGDMQTKSRQPTKSQVPVAKASDVEDMKREVHDLKVMVQDLISAVRDKEKADVEVKQLPETDSADAGEVTLDTDMSDAGSAAGKKKRRKRTKRRTKETVVVGLTESDSDTHSVGSGASCRSCGSSASRYSSSYERDPKLPKFTGAESWKVWFTRFDDIASRREWDDEKRLDVIVSRIDGSAADFVFDELTTEERGSYSKLIQCLHSRFRKIEGEKAFQAMFWRRKQKSAESEEAYAADLKRIYGKAFPSRDCTSRRDDLLRRFLSGLADNDASHDVEFVKDPRDIDEALEEIVKYRETREPSYADEDRGPTKRRVARVQGEEAEEQAESADDVKVARVNPVETKPAYIAKAGQAPRNPDNAYVTMSFLKEQMDELKKLLKESKGGPGEAQNTQRRRGRNQSGNVQCYNCQGYGHFARDCSSSRRSRSNSPQASEQRYRQNQNSNRAERGGSATRSRPIARSGPSTGSRRAATPQHLN